MSLTGILPVQWSSATQHLSVKIFKSDIFILSYPSQPLKVEILPVMLILKTLHVAEFRRFEKIVKINLRFFSKC